MSQAMEDKDAIREAMGKYCHALDKCRFADVAALFVPDGEWVTDYGAARGRAEIEALLSNTVPRKGEGPQRKHYIANVVINLDGDMAHCVADYLVVREAEHGLIPGMGGTYRDTLRRQEGGWFFLRKEIVHDIGGNMALKNGR